jgi:hypothetical protein
VVECLRHGGEDLKPEVAPKMNGRQVGFDDCVELDAVVSARASPREHIDAQGTPDAMVLMRWVDHEAGRCDV